MVGETARILTVNLNHSFSLNDDDNTFPSSSPESLESFLAHKLNNTLCPSPEDEDLSSPSENLESLLSRTIKNILYPPSNDETPDIPPDHKNSDSTSKSSNISNFFSARQEELFKASDLYQAYQH